MPVKRALLIAAFLVATPVNAEISEEVKATCMEAKDFVGCVKALSGGVQVESDDGLNPLRNSMKQVAARLESGTSLRDSTSMFQPVVDQLAIVKEKYPDSLAVKTANRAVRLFDILQSAWQNRISTLSVGSGSFSTTTYSCYATKNGVAEFESHVGSPVIGWSVQGGIFGLGFGCPESVGLRHERKMMTFVVGVLKEGSVSPDVIEKYEADRAEKYRLANMSAWEKHLDKNPGLKAWSVANPAMAAKEQAKFNAKNPQKEVNIPAYEDTLGYLRWFRPSL